MRWRRRRDPGLIGGVMVGAACRQGLGARGRQAADRRQSPGRPCAVPAPGRSGSRLSVSAAARLRRALPAARGARASAITGVLRPPSTMPRARRSTRRPSCSGSAYPGGPAIEELAKQRRPSRRAAAAPAGRLGRAAFLLCRAQERGAARSRVGRASPRRHRGELPAGGGRLSRRSHPARASATSDAPALVVAGGVAANQAIVGALADLAMREGRRFSVPPGMAVHRQCGDDRLGRRGALAAGLVRRARRAGARALAARSKRREGARRGREGVRLGIIGGGAWGTALAQVASHGRPRDAALGDRGRCRRGDQSHPTRTRFTSEGAEARPSNPGYRPISPTSTSCDAWLVVTPAQHMRTVLARMRPCSAGIRSSCARRVSRKAGRSCFTRSRAKPVPDLTGRGALGSDLRARGGEGLADGRHPGGAKTWRSPSDSATISSSRPSAFTFRTMWPARRSAGR